MDKKLRRVLIITMTFNPLTMIWLMFWITDKLDLHAWYGVPFVLTAIIIIIFSGFVDVVIIQSYNHLNEE